MSFIDVMSFGAAMSEIIQAESKSGRGLHESAVSGG